MRLESLEVIELLERHCRSLRAYRAYRERDEYLVDVQTRIMISEVVDLEVLDGSYDRGRDELDLIVYTR